MLGSVWIPENDTSPLLQHVLVVVQYQKFGARGLCCKGGTQEILDKITFRLSCENLPLVRQDVFLWLIHNGQSPDSCAQRGLVRLHPPCVVARESLVIARVVFENTPGEQRLQTTYHIPILFHPCGRRPRTSKNLQVPASSPRAAQRIPQNRETTLLIVPQRKMVQVEIICNIVVRPRRGVGTEIAAAHRHPPKCVANSSLCKIGVHQFFVQRSIGGVERHQVESCALCEGSSEAQNLLKPPGLVNIQHKFCVDVLARGFGEIERWSG
mmetsp:Transcript_21099/g.46363  ORF Transcript_21099/g.46363 Transcript_21099/m.46363 type:complete len:268 (+) Transcript_21099:790-1593(+)